MAARTHADLASRYSAEMEVQCNVLKLDGERVDNTYKGKTLIAWTNGLQTWKPFRIPYNAGTKPEYNFETKQNFDLDTYAEGIGMTGWNWVQRVSKYVAYDFDAIAGHSERHTRKCSEEELSKVKELVQNIPWVEVRKSTGGKGLHLYVHVNNIPTENHHEHAALARSILGMLSGIVGFDFGAKLDVMGGNMWVWHRKMEGTDGLSLLKSAVSPCEVPINWRDHIPVIRGDRKRIKPSNLDESHEDAFDILTTTRTMVALDPEHKKFIEHLDKIGSSAYWDHDRGMLTGHTFEFALASEELGLKGIFKTLATGSERGTDINAFAYPMKNGAWVVRRFTPGVEEASTWTQDSAGWTKCYINRDLDLETAARAAGGIEDEKSYFFAAAQDASTAVKSLGGNLDLPEWTNHRKARIKKTTDDSKLVVELERTKEEVHPLPGWVPQGKFYRKVVPVAATARITDIDSNDIESKFRHIVTETGADAGWAVHNEHNSWIEEPLANIRLAFKSLGFKAAEIDGALGAAVLHPWIVVNQPFKDEYPGNRIWNRTKAQLQFKPTLDKDKEDLHYPHWNRIFDHLGIGLDFGVSQHPWCKENGILNGSDWLKCWVSSLFQNPTQPLPYLFFYGEQNQGKSTLVECLELLIGTEGVMQANNALTSDQAFNGELLSAVVCVVEELDLGTKRGTAYNRIKDWTVAPYMQVHVKHMTPYKIPNTTHWIQLANDIRYCPILPGDTRITMIRVEPLAPEDIIPKAELMARLRAEAPDFLAAILAMELPRPESRFNIPVIETFDKAQAQEMNREPIEEFFSSVLFQSQGHTMTLQTVYEEFAIWCKDFCPETPVMARFNFERHPIISKIKGRKKGDSMIYLANVSRKPMDAKTPIVVKDGWFYSNTGAPL